MDGEPAAQGAWGTVEWGFDASGKARGRDFFSGLSDADAAKVQALFRRFAETGRMNNSEQFKKVRDMNGLAIWEFKRFQLRFLGCFVSNRRFLVALGLKKKRDRHRPRDLERAVRILTEHLLREAENG